MDYATARRNAESDLQKPPGLGLAMPAEGYLVTRRSTLEALYHGPPEQKWTPWQCCVTGVVLGVIGWLAVVGALHLAGVI